MKSVEDRFESKFVPEPMSGCWLWLGHLGNGYGRFWDGKRPWLAHRFSYELYRCPIPEGLVIDHLCRTCSCVNPDHLEPKTHRENLLAPGSLNFTKEKHDRTHCPQGHALFGGNLATSKRKQGRRACKACNSARAALYTLKREGIPNLETLQEKSDRYYDRYIQD